MRRTTTVLLFLLALMWLDLTLSKAYFESQILHYNPINGDFQTYNPLRRMAAGQMPGRDFQPYMGLGITYATYLPFALMGENFAASKFSAQLLHMWLFGLGTFVLFLLLRFPWVMALGLSFVLQLYAYAASDYLYTIFIDWKIVETALPFSRTLSALSHAENSCLGIRVALPLLTAGLMLLIYRRWPKISGSKEALLWGVIAGAQVPWSNDYGFTSLAALSFVYLVFRWRLSPSLKALLLHFIAIAAGAYAVLMLATAGYPLRALEYNFGGVAKDQFWYFMLDEKDKVFSLMQYVKAKRIFFLAGICAAFTGGIFIYLLRQKKSDIRDILFVYILGCSLAAGLLATIGGGILERYFSASLRLLPFAALFVLLRYCPLPRLKNSVLVLGLLCGVSFHLVFHPVSFWNVKQEIQAKTAGHFFYSAWAGGYLANSQKQEIAIAASLPKSQTVFSTYSSLMDAVSGHFQPSGIDYVIHALGRENRAHYLESFTASDPDVVTTPNELWTLWEVWSRRVNWWFYREMLRIYKPANSTFYHVIWHKRAQPQDVTKYVSQAHCKIEGAALRVTDRLPPGMYYVELQVAQQTLLKPSGVPIVGNRALLTIEEQGSGFNAIAGKQIAVPDIRTYNADYTLSPQLLVVEHKAGSPSLLKLHIAPKERATLKIDSCAVTRVYHFPTPPAPLPVVR